MARNSGPLFLVYDTEGASYTKKIRTQSGKFFVMHNGQVMEIRKIGYESIVDEEKIPATHGKPIYVMVGEYAFNNTI
jgi:hypothetical protein